MSEEQLRLATHLLFETVENKLSWQRVRPAVLALLGGSVGDRQRLLEALSTQDVPEVVALRRELLSEQMNAARRVFEARSRTWTIDTPTRSMLAHLPLDVELRFASHGGLDAVLKPIATAAGDLAFALRKDAIAAKPAIERAMMRATQTGAQALRAGSWTLGAAIDGLMPRANETLARSLAALREYDDNAVATRKLASKAALDAGVAIGSQNADEATFLAWLAASTDARAKLNASLAWPTETAAEHILANVVSTADEERAALLLTVRTGLEIGFDWPQYRAWLLGLVERAKQNRETARAAVQAAPEAVIIAYLQDHREQLGSLAPRLFDEIIAATEPSASTAFMGRWSSVLSQDEQATLSVPTFVSVAVVAAETVTETPPEPEKPKEPGMLGMLWREHLQAFVVENWYLVLSLGLVLIGASLLAYYTWDKHWLVRYTLAPAMLAALTLGVARLGSWLVAKDPKLAGSAALLRGTAVALLPLNFMTVALFAGDPDVPLKIVTVPMFAFAYIGFAAFTVRRWTSAMNATIASPFALTLVALNALVFLAPLFTLAGDSPAQPYILAAGAYLGLIIGALFLQRVVLKNLPILADRTLVLFVSLTLLLTYVQVQLWVFGYLHVLPEPKLYALLFSFAGFLVLSLERQFISFAAQAASVTGEAVKYEHKKEASFIGFALLGLSVLLSLGDPYLRVLTLIVSGVIWIGDAWRKPTKVAHYIGLTLISLGLGSMAIVQGFPHVLIGPLMIAIALAHFGIARAATRYEEAALSSAAEGLHATLLFLGAAMIMGVQWTWKAYPLFAGAELLVIAGLLLFAAERNKELRFVYTGAFLIAFALPYFGAVDLDTLELEGNLMPFALAIASLAWLGLVHFTQAPLLLKARSTTLTFYGALAVAALLVRLTAERDAVVFSLHSIAELAGPIAMAIIMVFATYYSRSWIPAVIAGFVVVVLVPDLKAALHIGVSTGLGSALIALGMLVASFYLRRSAFLRDMPAGDAWMLGEKFPFARYDHTLFTAPLVLTMAILTLRTDTIGVVRNWENPTLAFCAGLLVTVISYTLLGVYLGEPRKGRTLVYAAPAVLYMALGFGNVLFTSFQALDVLVATGLCVHLAYFVYTRVLVRRFAFGQTLLAGPMRRLLEGGSALSALLAATLLFAGLHPLEVLALVLFATYQISWHGYVRKEYHYGALLFVLALTSALVFAEPSLLASKDTWLLSLPERIDYRHSFPAALVVASLVHILLLVLEPFEWMHDKLRGLVVPSHMGSTALALLLVTLAAVGGATLPLTLPVGMLLAATFALGFMVARAERSVPIALYVFACVLVLPFKWSVDHDTTIDPGLVLSLAALCLIWLTWIVRAGSVRWPSVFSGSFSLPFLTSTSDAPAHVLVLVLCAFATLSPALDLVDHGGISWHGLLSGFVVASNVGLVAKQWQKPILHYAGWSALALANCFVAAAHLRDPLLARGLGDAHVIAIGLGVTLVVSTLLTRFAKDPDMTRTAERSSVVLATAIIGLLSVKYLVHPNLQEMSPWRFAVSGGAAYLAALYLRQAAKREGALWLTALSHFGVSMALWCAALLLPPLRAPGAALIALGVPLVYFYVRSELSRSVQERERYADSATAMSFLVFGVYTLRFALQLALFGETAPDHGYYHLNAPAVLVVGLIMFRLHALRKNAWLATFGGLALMLASFFLATWPARFSPFQHMEMAALVGIALAHFWIAFAAYNSPLRSGLMKLADMQITAWPSHARVWSVTLLIGVHVLFALATLFSDGLFSGGSFGEGALWLAPIVFGMVTVVWHLASGWRSPTLFVIGGIELLGALHTGFLVDGSIPKALVVWAVITCFALLIAGRRALEWLFDFTAIGRAAFVLTLVGFAHVLFHHPSSVLGLLAMGAIAVLAAATPFVRGFRTELPIAEGALVLVVPWLVYFSQAHLDVAPERAAAPWPLHALAASLLLIAGISRWLHDAGPAPQLARLGAAVVAFLNERYQAVQLVFATITFSLLLFVRYGTWTSPLPIAEVGLACTLYAAIAYGAWARGRAVRLIPLFLLAEFCIEQIFETARYQVMLTNAAVWRPDYDVVAMLLASLALAAVKELVDLEREELFPVVGTLVGLPVAALSYTLWNGMGLDVALFIIGINSLIFAFMGRNEKESPYNVIAIFGFIAFLLSVFRGKLELTTLHAYTIPIGVGVLALVHLYERVLERSVRANIRLLTLGVMLATTGYHALLDNRFPLVFHMTFIVLSVAIMAVGGLMRVKIYVVVGFFGALFDALALLVKTVSSMNRGPRMTLIGAFILLVGAALLGGAIYYKAHRDALMDRYSRLRSRFAGWE